VQVGSCLAEDIHLSDPNLLEVDNTSIFSSSAEDGHITDFSAALDSLLSVKVPLKVENS
jgi:hypothetical protein